MKDIFTKAKLAVNSKLYTIVDELDSGMKMVKEVINGLPIFISLERIDNDKVEYDEKHYFVIPYYLSDTSFSLHTMRSLPTGVPEVNSLPKRRVFHFPNEHWEGTLREYILSSARNIAYKKQSETTNSIEKLANDIDALDNKLTYGMLLVGGLAAIFNPILGAGIAVKALLPSISGVFAKYGLRPLGEKWTRSQMEQKAKKAEEHALKQFSESTTVKVVNPILSELEFALRTNEDEHDPLSDPNLANAGIKELDTEYWRELTETAIYHVYKDIINDKSKHKEARLGPEDLRWLEVLLAGK